MKKILLASVAVCAFCAAPALAADMPVKAPVRVVDPGYNWSGCYAGGDIGGSWGDTKTNIPLYPLPNQTHGASGVDGGLLLGCNYMTPSRWVFGVEGDYSWMNEKSDGLSGNGGTERYVADWKSSASLRARLGFSPANTPMTLWYVTGGAAWANATSQFVPLAGGTWNHTASGWTIGAGVEQALANNWILGLEYLYADYGRDHHVYLGLVNEKFTDNAVRVRLTYKFGGDPWGKGPVVAKY